MTPTWQEMAGVFGRIGVLSFGGPAAQIALMHRVLVDERRWLDEAEYLRALSFCMLLPGPEAMQLATYAGWRLRGVPGGLLAGLLFVAPGAALILALAAGYVAWGGVPWVIAVFVGVKAAVVVIVIEALLRVGKRALKAPVARLMAVLAFLALAGFGLPFPVVILVAAVAGALLLGPAGLSGGGTVAPPAATQGGFPYRVIATLAGLWALPLGLAWATGAGFLLEVGLFFSKLAVVTFGGAYAVLAWMAQTVTADMGWLGHGQMMDALGLAETTPGPLILVTEFVAYVAGARFGPGTAVLSALMALWVTFVPCFLWVFAGAPYIAGLTGKPRLAGALAGVSAAVVGVIASLGLWFAIHALFGSVRAVEFGPVSLDLPVASSLQPGAALITLVAGLALLRWHWPLIRVLVLAGAMGLVLAAG